MTYTAEDRITTTAEVKDFLRFAVDILGDEFHPDDDFSIYKDKKTKLPVFGEEETALYNRLLQECFTVCEAADEDIYDIGWEIIEKWIDRQ